jgi:hypothetical protein
MPLISSKGALWLEQEARRRLEAVGFEPTGSR